MVQGLWGKSTYTAAPQEAENGSGPLNVRHRIIIIGAVVIDTGCPDAGRAIHSPFSRA
jgi:hypothetical protein